MGRVRTDHTLLMPAFALPGAPAPLPGRPSLLLWPTGHAGNAPLPRLRDAGIPRFGVRLSPVALSAPYHSTSELLRTLSRMAASKPTSWLSGQRDHLSHYSRHFGTLAAGLGCFPLDRESSHPRSHSRTPLVAFAVWLGLVSALPPHPSSLPTSTSVLSRAEPQSISGRTSYLRVRLAFHPYPQLIRHFCNSGQFAPPVRVTGPSHWPRVAHPVSGLHRAMRPLSRKGTPPCSDSPSLWHQTFLVFRPPRGATRRLMLQ